MIWQIFSNRPEKSAPECPFECGAVQSLFGQCPNAFVSNFNGASLMLKCPSTPASKGFLRTFWVSKGPSLKIWKQSDIYIYLQTFLLLLILSVGIIEILTLVFVRWWVGPNMGVSWAVATSGGSPPSNPFKIQDHAPHQFQIFFHNPRLFQILVLNPDPVQTTKIYLHRAF